MAQSVESVARKYALLHPHLDERQRRLVLGPEASELGRGGIKAVSVATGSTPIRSRVGSVRSPGRSR